MLKNYLKIAIRQLKKQKFYSAVNIFGLAIGVACCLLIALFINDELSYDQQHPNVQDLYRIHIDYKMTGIETIGNAIPPILPKKLKSEIPEVKEVALLNSYFGNAGSNLVRRQKDKNNQFEDKFVYVDQSFFELFHLPLVQINNGPNSNSTKDLVTKPNTVVITKRIADKYFNNSNPVGEILVLNDEIEQSFTITGVIENIPAQSHFHYDFFMSMVSLEDSRTNTGWVSNNYFGYVSLAPGTDPKTLETKLQEFTSRNFGPEFKEMFKTDLATLKSNGQHMKLGLQPVTDIHLYSDNRTPTLETQGDIRFVKLISAIALFIFLIALVNFVNLSTARSSNRAKEVGLRKVLGSFQKQLITQFLTESVLMSLIAFIIGGSIAALFLPLFNDLAGKNLTIPFTSISFIGLMLGISVIAGILAGLYPSFYLSAFQPVKILKGKLSMGAKSSWLRSGLVVIQFTISIGLIIGTLVVYSQMQYIQNKKLGFKKDQVLLIQDTYNIFDELPLFKEDLKKIPEAANVTISSYLPLDGGRRNSIIYYPEGKNSSEDQVLMQSWFIDEDYLSTLSMELVIGRNFKEELLSDSMSIILNETAVKNFNLGDKPLGQTITSPFFDNDFTVIGVVKDFNFESLRGKVGPLSFIRGMSSSVVSVKTTAAEMDNLIAKAETSWKKFAPSKPFRYDFLDDRFATMYKTEDRVGTLFGIFSILAIFIACLGLLALATFMTEQRRKEIGIRKVLGASVSAIVFQLSKKFLLYVLIGLVIAVPIAWIYMGNWLNNFAYRINMEWWMFTVAGLLAIVIAFATVGLQSLKAALENPVESIKTE